MDVGMQIRYDGEEGVVVATSPLAMRTGGTYVVVLRPGDAVVLAPPNGTAVRPPPPDVLVRMRRYADQTEPTGT